MHGFCQGERKGGAHFLGAATVEERAHAVSVDAVVVAEEVARLDAVGHRFAELLDYPGHGWRRRDGPVQDSSAAMLKDDEDEKCAEGEGGNGEEVYGPGNVEVIAQEWQPRRGGFARPARLDHVLQDGVGARPVVAEKAELPANALRAPERILSAQLADERLHLHGDLRPAGSGFPTPVKPEGPGVPLLDGGRLHHLSQVFPSVEQLGEDYPEDSECLVEARTRSFAGINAVLADGQLALQRKNVGGQYRLLLQQ